MWEMRCDECGRAYHAKDDDMVKAKAAASRDGWLVGSMVQCPSCAAAEAPESEVASSAEDDTSGG